MTKKINDVVLDEYAKSPLDGATLEDALHQIKKWIQDYGGKARLDIGEASQDYYGNGDKYAYVHIRGEREETDDEYAKRLDDEQTQANIQEQREKAEFERLAKKFADKK